MWRVGAGNVAVTKNDDIYVSDSTSGEKTNPGFMQGIRTGNVKDGKVTAFIPETKELGALEGGVKRLERRRAR